MKFTYEPTSGDDDVTEIFGQVVEAGEAVEITDERQIAKLKGHPEFAYSAKDKDAKEAKTAADAKAKQGEKLTKIVDGRSKEARAARAKADEANADAEAKERAEAQARAIAEARAEAENQ